MHVLLCRSEKLTYSALYLAIALVLPFLTGQIPEIGSMPAQCTFQHCCAALFAAGRGLAVGFVSPLLRSLLWDAYGLYGSGHGV